MPAALLVDFGSTYTKVSAVSLDQGCLLARAQAPTTYGTDLREGLAAALRRLERQLDGRLPRFAYRLACSSAGGGLRMVAIGLVPELTAEAARRAALGAGARVLATYSGPLDADQLEELCRLRPDMVLLAGGTDGGNRTALMAFAQALAGCPLNVPIVLAGNREAAPEAADTLRRAGRDVRVVENVLPRLDVLNVEPAREAVRQLFMERIAVARGWERVQEELDGILMPTPAAALQGATLLADGDGQDGGLGELLVVDVGGATTDVHSVAEGLPRDSRTVLRGVPPSRCQRTVEGDLGLRHGAPSLLDASSLLSGEPEHDARWRRRVQRRFSDPAYVPEAPEERQADQLLAREAVRLAVERHAGRLELLVTPHGRRWIQRGKDLRPVGHVIGTGGVFLHAPDPAGILVAALGPQGEPGAPDQDTILKPHGATLWVDSLYILSHAGLLAQVAPAAALRLMRASLRRVA